jgi:FG-GAP-like repeat
VLAGDVNGDGKADLTAIYNYGNLNWRAWTFFGPDLAASVPTGINSGPSDATQLKATLADINGDGWADLCHFYNVGGQTRLYVLYGTGTGFGPETLRWDSTSVTGGLAWTSFYPY